MDDQQSYLLNGLLTRQFALGRILRFRQVDRGRQATTFELLTSEHREYLVYLYSPTYDPAQLSFAADALNTLDDNRFSVVPFLKTTAGRLVAEGPQNAHLLVSLGTAGSPLPPEQYSDHDVSQVGLRLAWLHRLLREQIPAPAPALPPLSERLRVELESATTPPPLGPLTAAMLATILSMLHLPAAQGWVHGDIQPSALLHDSDHQLRTVVDWALLHYGSPLEDLVDAFLNLCADNQGRLLTRRGRILLESYHSLQTINRIPWTPVVASWMAQRLLNAAQKRRPLPPGFTFLLEKPESLATALASCL